MNYLKINYEHICVNENGEYVLFLHGWGGSIESFKIFQKCLNNLNLNTINLDLYGFGKTEIKNNLTIYEYAMQIFLFLKQQNISQISIVAHSFGARIAIILASLFDINIKYLIITGGAGVKQRKSLCYYYKIWKYKIYKFLKYNLKFKVNLNNFGSVDYKNANEKLKYVLNNAVNEDLTFLLPYIKNETLLIWGGEDKITPYYMCKKLYRKIINSSIIKFENCGHFAYLENSRVFANIMTNLFSH